MKTKLRLQKLIGYALIQITFCMAGISPSVAQYLSSKWYFGKPGKFETVSNMDVSASGDVIAVVEKVGDDFVTVLYSKENAQLWRELYTEAGDGIGMRRDPRAVAYSEVDGGVFVLASEYTPTEQNGVLIKYRRDGTREFANTISNGYFYPEVMTLTDDGGVIVAGVAIDFSFDGPGDRGSMYVVKYSSIGDYEWSEMYTLGVAITVPKRMERDRHNLYITGVATTVPVTGGYRLDRHPDSRMFTMKIDLSASTRRSWHMFNGPVTGGFSYGYDLDADSDGVVVVGQSIARESGISVGNTIVTKYNPSGDEEWSKTLPSNYRTYGKIDRNILDRFNFDEIYVAYTPRGAEEATAARIVKYNRYGDMLDETDIRLDGPTEIESLGINHATHDLYVGLRIGTTRDDYHTKIQIYAADGTLIGEDAARDHQSIRQIELIDNPDPVTYPTGTRTLYTCGGQGDRYNYIEKFEKNILFSPFPAGFEIFNTFGSRRSGRDRWVIDYLCEIATCSDIFMNASGFAGGKEMWKEDFNKPVDLTLPSKLNPDTYVLSAKQNGKYQQLISTDENMFINGIKDFNVKTDTKARSITLNATTSGKDVPFVMTWYNKESKLIKTETFSAPLTKEIKDPMSEAVSFIRFTAGSIPLQMTYYPNPSSGDFQVTVGDDTKVPAQVFVYDMNNTRIYQQEVGTERTVMVKLSGQKPGLYVLLLKDGGSEKRELIQIK